MICRTFQRRCDYARAACHQPFDYDGLHHRCPDSLQQSTGASSTVPTSLSQIELYFKFPDAFTAGANYVNCKVAWT